MEVESIGAEVAENAEYKEMSKEETLIGGVGLVCSGATGERCELWLRR
jgi:hypothetical protein